jgi:hypothetical protein
MSDPLIRLLAELPPAEPDAARAERIRARCQAHLARQAARAPAARECARPFGTRDVWQPLVALLGAAYLTEVIVLALRLYSF